MSNQSDQPSPYAPPTPGEVLAPDDKLKPVEILPPPGEMLGHPKALWMLFSAEFWERFCFYGMRAILVIYVAQVFFADLSESDAKKQASLTYGGYTSLVYATGILGGLIADRILGYRRSIMLGGTLMAVGMFLLLTKSLPVFLLGLSVIVVGNGLFKPNISSIVGKLYAPGDVRRDSGFIIFYMGVNLGAFLAPIICATIIGKIFGMQYGFLTAAIGMIFGITIFHWYGGMLGEIGKPPVGRKSYLPVLQVLLGAILMVPAIYLLLSKSDLLGIILTVLMVGLSVYFVASGFLEGDKVQLHRYLAMLILFSANILFWALFEQAGSSLNFLAKDFVEAPFDFSLFQSFNAFFIVALAPVFSLLWPWLDKRGLNPSIPMKFSLALIGVGLGFLVLNLAIRTVGPTGKISWQTLGLTYLIHTVAELLLSPIGLSMVTKLAKSKDVGLAMGGWFLTTSVGNYLAGQIAARASGGSGGHDSAASSIDQYATVFNQIWWLGAIAGLVFLVISPLVNKLMHGVK